MPKWGVHYLIMRKAIDELESDQSLSAKNKKAISSIKSEESLALIGSVGPDILFFAPDYKNADRMYQLYKNIQDVLDVWEKVTKPIREVEEEIEEQVDSIEDKLDSQALELAKESYEEIKETSNLFKSTVKTGLFENVVSGFDFISDHTELPSVTSGFFDLFVPPAQKNEPIEKWYWFDVLHYRSTGEFARNLIELSDSKKEKAYSYGYLSHIAGDVVGHSYVNEVVGGPYRTQVQRHVVMENFMDTWSMYKEDGSSVNNTLFDKLGLDSQDELPDSVAKLLSEAMKETYSNEPHPQRLQPDDFMSPAGFKNTFKKFRLVNKISRDMHVEAPEEPFDGASRLLEEALSDLTDAPPSPPNPQSSSGICDASDIFSFGATQNSRECYEKAFEELKNWAEYFKEFYEWCIQTLVDIVDLIITSLAALPVKVILALNYKIKLLLYNFYSNMRFELALYGYVTPEPHAVRSSHMRNLVTTYQLTEGGDYSYPHLKEEGKSHLVFPTTGLETPKTVPDFHDKADINTTPEKFIFEKKFRKKSLIKYANSKSPTETKTLENNGEEIGNATDFSKWSIKVASDMSSYEKDEIEAVFANWNLSADRGYGFKCWDGGIPDISSDQNVSVESVSYKN